MKYTEKNYKGFVIQKRVDVKTNTCIIYKDGEIVKCIAGDILTDGTENSIEKAKDYINVNNLSVIFSRRLIAEIGNQKIKRVIHLNNKEKSNGICHTHDFCDANQIIIDSYQELTGGSADVDINNEDFFNLTSKAWNKARENNFYL